MFRRYNQVRSVYTFLQRNGLVVMQKKLIDYHLSSLKIDILVLGKDHPDVANRYNRLGELYKEAGNTETAHEYFLKALAICHDALDIHHHLTKKVQMNIDGL